MEDRITELHTVLETCLDQLQHDFQMWTAIKQIRAVELALQTALDTIKTWDK